MCECLLCEWGWPCGYKRIAAPHPNTLEWHERQASLWRAHALYWKQVAEDTRKINEKLSAQKECSCNSKR